MDKPVLQIDIAIIGGGIAGLWALNQLRGSGYSAVLFEHDALGGDQTAASQGILHSGIKYNLSDALQGDSDSMSAMPAIWRDCLAGRGNVDLRACRVLSEYVYLWSNTAFSPRLRAYLTGASAHGSVVEVHADARPVPLQAAAFRGEVYRADEQVLDVGSLVATLAAQQREAIFSIDWGRAALQCSQRSVRLALPHCTVLPQRWLLAAGAGNDALIAGMGGRTPAMQRRPLQQVLVKHQYAGEFHAHCVGSKSSPRLTITTHRTRTGEMLWSLGGDLATEGAGDDAAQLIARARREVADLLPWLDLGTTEWRTLKLDRAEPRQRFGLRADRAFIDRVDAVDNVLVGWPTKLCLCPELGDRLQRALLEQDILPRHSGDLAPLHGLGRPPLAPPCWDMLFS